MQQSIDNIEFKRQPKVSAEEANKLNESLFTQKLPSTKAIFKTIVFWRNQSLISE
jgi:hypothetical protein